MSYPFTHENVRDHWDGSKPGPVECDEYDQFCFSDVASEWHIEVYRASNEAFSDLVAFWIAVAKQALEDGTRDGERWVKEYLSGGEVERVTAGQFLSCISRHTETLLPEFAIDVPEPSDQFVGIWINRMDNALVGEVPTGYWALRCYSTA